MAALVVSFRNLNFFSLAFRLSSTSHTTSAFDCKKRCTNTITKDSVSIFKDDAASAAWSYGPEIETKGKGGREAAAPSASMRRSLRIKHSHGSSDILGAGNVVFFASTCKNAVSCLKECGARDRDGSRKKKKHPRAHKHVWMTDLWKEKTALSSNRIGFTYHSRRIPLGSLSFPVFKASGACGNRQDELTGGLRLLLMPRGGPRPRHAALRCFLFSQHCPVFVCV